MQFVPTCFDGVWLIELERLFDARGFFARTFCEREFEKQGLVHHFVQHSVSCSYVKGTLRGMHFQAPPQSETKLVRCISGAIYDVVVDVRPASPTYLKWAAFELSAENGRQLYIPGGFAHGFQSRSDGATVLYLINAFHKPDAARGLRYDDPRVAIDWPLPIASISERDEAWPSLSVEQPA